MMIRLALSLLTMLALPLVLISCGSSPTVSVGTPEPSWSPQTSGTSDDLQAVVFSGPDRGWAVGDRGTLLATSDGGTNWTPQTSGREDTLFGIDFTHDSHGCAVGWNPDDWLNMESSVVLGTSDGQNWKTLGEGSGNLFDVKFEGTESGWAVGARGEGGLIIGTEDGAVGWTEQYAGGRDWLYGVDFADQFSGCAVGGRTVLATNDSGVTWTRRRLERDVWLVDVAFGDPRHVWAVGEKGVVMASADGGLSWSRQPSGVMRDLNGVAFVDSRTGWAVGDKGTVITTTDGGASWTSEDSMTTRRLYDVHATDPTHAWAVGTKGTILSRTPVPPSN